MKKGLGHKKPGNQHGRNRHRRGNSAMLEVSSGGTTTPPPKHGPNKKQVASLARRAAQAEAEEKRARAERALHNGRT